MENSTSIIQNLQFDIGDQGLIIEAKAYQLYKGCKLSQGEIERILHILNSKDLNINEIRKTNLALVILYFQAESSYDKVAVFQQKAEQWLNNKSSLRSGVNLEQLHIIFNIIEFEDKFKLMNMDQLKLLLIQLSTFEKLEKPFEDYVLYNYYTAILKFNMKDYQSAKNCVLNVVIDLGDEIKNKDDKTYVIDYIELKNSLLNVRIHEKENESKEVITSLEGLYASYSRKDYHLTLKLGFKMCDFYLSFNEFDKSSTLLMQLYKTIQKMMLFGNCNPFPDFIETCLNVTSRIIYCGVILGKFDECIKFIKKLEKFVTCLKDYEVSNSKEIKESLVSKYQFYIFIYKIICRYGTVGRTDLNNSMNSYRTVFRNQIYYQDDVIINFYALNSSDVLAKNFFDKVNIHMSLVANNKMDQINYIFVFFSIYNQISQLSKNLATDTNIRMQLQYLEKIKTCSKNVVDYITKYIDYNYELKNIFSFPYFKEVLIKTYFSYIFSYYHIRDYKNALKFLQDFDDLKSKIDLSSGLMLKHYSSIIKLKGDVYFKLEDYSQACSCYSRVIQIYEEILNHSQTMAMVLFNLGISYFYNKEFALSKKNLNLCKAKYELLNSIQQNKFTDKVKQVTLLIQQLNPVWSAYE